MIRMDLALRNRMLMGIEKRIDLDASVGEIKVFTGVIPATPESTAVGTLLATLLLPNPVVADIAMTGAPTWLAGEATFTATNHGLVLQSRAIVKDTTTNLFDGEFTISSVPDSNTFVVPMASDPGAAGIEGSFRGVSNGVLIFDPNIVEDSEADFSGIAGWARLFATVGDAFGVLDVDVGVTGGNEALLFNTTNFVAGEAVSISSFTIAIPAAG